MTGEINIKQQKSDFLYVVIFSLLVLVFYFYNVTIDIFLHLQHHFFKLSYQAK